MRLSALLLGTYALFLAVHTASAQPADIVRPEVLEAPEAPYPGGAHGDAAVVLELEVAEDGSVAKATVRSGEPPFDSAARAAVMFWRLSPATRNGIPIRARVLARVEFKEPPPAPKPEPRPVPERLTDEANPGIATRAVPPATPAPAPESEPIEITVVGEDRQELGSIYIPRADARRIPGAFADPFRVVEVLPGVAPVLSGLPYFFVRGAPPGDVGYFIDGIPVPLLFHVGAGPSIIAPPLVDRVDLFPGAYPARFGRYAGAVMAGETTTPSNVPRGEAQARIFDAGAMVEQPFAGGRGSVLLGGRYSYTGALMSLVTPEYSLDYWDYQARIAYFIGAENRLSAFAFGALDKVENLDIDHPIFDTTFHRLDLRWDHASTNTRARVAGTLGSDRVFSAEDEATDPGSYSRSRRLGLRAELEQRFSPQARLRVGTDGAWERFSSESERNGRAELRFPARNDYRVAGYADAILRPIPAVEVVPGVRVDFERSRGKDHVFPEPRLSTRVRVRSKVAWLASFGLTHQLPSYAIAVPAERPDVLELTEQRAWQSSQGVEFVLPSSMLGRVTAFYSFIDAEAGLSGKNYGLEGFVRRDFTERLGGFLSYTLSRADRSAGRFTELSAYDRTHVLSAVLGYDFRHGVRAGARVYYASGRAYAVGCPTQDCGPFDEGAPRPFVQRGRMASFMRVDLRLEKRWTFTSGAWIAATFEWFNALLAREASEISWDPVSGGVRSPKEDPLTLPSIGVEAGY